MVLLVFRARGVRDYSCQCRQQARLRQGTSKSTRKRFSSSTIMKDFRGREQLVIFWTSPSFGSLIGCLVVGVLIRRYNVSCQACHPISDYIELLSASIPTFLDKKLESEFAAKTSSSIWSKDRCDMHVW